MIKYPMEDKKARSFNKKGFVLDTLGIARTYRHGHTIFAEEDALSTPLKSSLVGRTFSGSISGSSCGFFFIRKL